MNLKKIRIFKWICIFLPIFIVLVLILIDQLKREHFGIDAKDIQKITIITQPNVLGDYNFAIEDDKDINVIFKSLNNIAYYPSNELPGESSPYASITFYKNYKRFALLDFYGGFAGITYFNDDNIAKGELHKTGFLTDLQLSWLCRKLNQ